MCATSMAQNSGLNGFDAAAAFGARESVSNLSLSPDGTRVAYVTPRNGQASAVMVRGVGDGATVQVALLASGDPERISHCNWVSNERIVCVIYGVLKDALLSSLPFNRVVAVDADGSKLKLLSTEANAYTRGFALGGGSVIDWLPDEDGSVLMARLFIPDDHTGSRTGSSKDGYGVDRVDTKSLVATPVELPRREVKGYISDGRGTVRVMEVESRVSDQDTGVVRYLYRQRESRNWLPLSEYRISDRSGFVPEAVDFDRNIAYGFKRIDGRQAVCSIALDGSLHEEIVFARPDVDVDELIRIGRRNRVVGVSYATDARYPVFFDPDIERIIKSVSKALPTHPALHIADSSVDESKLLMFAGSDQDPGVYYVYDRKTHHLETFLVTRRELEGVKLAVSKPITYPATDGVSVPGYLTLPPGREDAKNLPAIVLPHGGPSARDEWGFDWLSQYFASRGYAVLQPNFRGSSGYGDAWFTKNGFQSWPTAIGDVLDAGRWLVAEGIADPKKLGIVGWSYGGYAALQSAVVDPSVFRAVVAISPVTDLGALKDQYRGWTNFDLVNKMIGDGPHVSAGSPAQHADKIKVPVLLFHGALDRNVTISESKLMAARLESVHASVELVTWPKLDHYLEDSAARTEMLRKSDAFLRQTLGM